MTIRTLLISLFVSLLFTACQPTPDVPLSPELNQYALIKENCESLRIIPGIHVPDALDKECRTFLRRLEKANALDYKLAHFNDDNPDPNAKPKPEYILLQTDAYRQHRKCELEYQALTKTLNSISQEAISHNERADVELTLTFPETRFTKEHYFYYKQFAPHYDADIQYLTFEKQYAEELVTQGLTYLSQGDKKRAIKTFKTSASLNNAQAEYLVGIVYEAKNIDKAIDWHTKAKEHGIAGAHINLARLYTRKHMPKEAQKLYLEAAEDGNAYAQYLLYGKYKMTTNKQTTQSAKKWLKRSAENGFPPAESAYGLQLLQEHKDEQAQEWLLKAKEHGINAVNAALGKLYYQQEKYREALAYLNAAENSYAKYQLGVMYERGLGVDIDNYKAYIYYKQALRLGKKSAKTDVERLAKLKTAKEEAHYDAAKRKEKKRQKAITQRCGEDPILRNIRSAGMSIHLRGFVTLPLQSTQGFIVHSEDGKQFYVINTENKADIAQYQYVDIAVKATGNAITVSNENGSTVNIYQFYFQKHLRDNM